MLTKNFKENTPAVACSMAKKEQKYTKWRTFFIAGTILTVSFLMTVYLFFSAQPLRMPCLVIALGMPLLTLCLYDTGVLPAEEGGDSDSIVLPLLFSSLTSMIYFGNMQYVMYTNYIQFVLPVILIWAFFFLLNYCMKKRKGRGLSLMLMVLWLLVYSVPFCALLNGLLPSVRSEDLPCKTVSTNYGGAGNYYAEVHALSNGESFTFKIPSKVYDGISEDTAAEVKLTRGLLGIDYAEIKPGGQSAAVIP